MPTFCWRSVDSETTFRDAADLVGQPISPRTYQHSCEYDALLQIHDACRRALDDHGRAKSAAASEWPDLYALYMMARMDGPSHE